jgi:hypothetical protein
MSSENNINKDTDEEQGRAAIPITVSSQPVTPTPVVYGQPYSQPYSEEQNRVNFSPFYVVMPFRSNTFDQTILMVAALAKSMRLLALVDLILLLVLSFFNVFYLVGLWGPVCGYSGARLFNSCLVYVYTAYWILRTLFDIIFVISGFWLFILSVAIDLYILSYVWTFARSLSMLSGEELQQLRTPPQGVMVVTSASGQ